MLTLVQLAEAVYDSLFCPACDIENGTAAEYRSTLNGVINAWRTSPIELLTKQSGLKTGWNTIKIEARDRQPDGSVGRTVYIVKDFYVDVEIP
jgi:hypothetical protein